MVESMMAGTGDLQMATFRFDVTPPAGHSLCGGWIPPVRAVDDPLEAIGFVLMGLGKPIVVCAVDWTGLCNEAHLRWREALAEGAGTTPDRVAVQCVHQHDAPFVCLETNRIVREQGDLPPNVDPSFFRRCLTRGRASVREALKRRRRVTHHASAAARVAKVASNRRILGDDGRVRKNRSVARSGDDVRHLPAGAVDPWLRAVAFYDGSTKVAACYYFAVHPISYCCDEGRVTSEFVGLARRLKQQHDDPESIHLYFTGCAGNINAGKYGCSEMLPRGKDHGSLAASDVPQLPRRGEFRRALTGRIYEAMETASAKLRPAPIGGIQWQTHEFLPPARRDLDAERIAEQIGDKSRSVVQRNRPAFTLAWLRRLQRSIPLTLSALHVNKTSILHLPAEPFVEYQLRAQALYPDRFIATAGYGDGGPWYIPTAEAYMQGGYEVNVAFCDPRIDILLMDGVRNLMGM